MTSNFVDRKSMTYTHKNMTYVITSQIYDSLLDDAEMNNLYFQLFYWN